MYMSTQRDHIITGLVTLTHLYMMTPKDYHITGRVYSQDVHDNLQGSPYHRTVIYTGITGITVSQK